jgi:hypothetical protein
MESMAQCWKPTVPDAGEEISNRSGAEEGFSERGADRRRLLAEDMDAQRSVRSKGLPDSPGLGPPRQMQEPRRGLLRLFFRSGWTWRKVHQLVHPQESLDALVWALWGGQSCPQPAL